jgi:hypothetical protein
MPVMPKPDEVREELVKNREGMGKPEITVTPKVKTPPLSLYQDVRKRPYSADYFELGEEWEHWNFPKEFATIEDFIKGEIKDQGLTDTVESYNEIIEGVESKIGKRENEKVWHKLDRLTSYINAVKNFRKWDAIKRKFEELNG